MSSTFYLFFWPQSACNASIFRCPYFTANLMFDIRHRNALRNISDLFHYISNIHPYNTRSSASHNFYTQSSRLSIQLNSFSRIGTKIWNEMPLTLRNLSKHDFKRKITRVLFNILSSEDSYLNIQNIIQKAKFSSAFNVLLYQRFWLRYRIYWVCNAHVLGATHGSEGVVFWRVLFVKYILIHLFERFRFSGYNMYFQNKYSLTCIIVVFL